DLITAENVTPGGINYQGMGMDQPLLAERQVSFVGQTLAVVLATTEREAERIANYVTTHGVAYGRVDWPAPFDQPILDLDTAIRANSVFPDTPKSAPYVQHIWKITRPDSQFDWVRAKDPLDRRTGVRKADVAGIECVVVEGTQTSGGQVHFYMETQACIAQPTDEGRLLMQPATQSPQEMHVTTAMAVASQYSLIDVQVAPVGGGFGGKTEQARFVTGPTAIAAKATKRPVRVALPRDDDTSLIGKRHAYYGQYQIAIDPGLRRPQDRGLMRGFQVKL